MAKKKAAKKSAPARPTKKEPGGKRRPTKTIKPPLAPPMMHSPELGAPVGQDQAIRERIRLFPRATVNEIVAMFELEGVRVTAAAVKKVKQNSN